MLSIKRFIFHTAVILTISLYVLIAQVSAQQPKKHLWQFDDALFIGAAAADITSSKRALNNCVGCYEKGIVKSQWLRAGIYAGIETAFKFYEWKHPESRNKTKWFRVVASTAITMVVVNNFKRSR